jgi:hypothetical protein
VTEARPVEFSAKPAILQQQSVETDTRPQLVVTIDTQTWTSICTL